MTSVTTAMADKLMAVTGEEDGQSSGKEIRTFRPQYVNAFVLIT